MRKNMDVNIATRFADLQTDIWSPVLQRWHEGWPAFWEEFGYTVTEENMEFIKPCKNFNWSIVEPDALTSQESFDIFKYLVLIASPIDLTKVEDLWTSKIAVLVRDRVEADEELELKSAKDLNKEQIKGIDLSRRLVLGARYFKETGEHLDVDHITLCNGSCYCYHDDHVVPVVYWNSRRGWIGISFRYYNDIYLNVNSRAVIF